MHKEKLVNANSLRLNFYGIMLWCVIVESRMLPSEGIHGGLLCLGPAGLVPAVRSPISLRISSRALPMFWANAQKTLNRVVQYLAQAPQQCSDGNALEVSVVACYANDVLKGLRYLHSNQILHRFARGFLGSMFFFNSQLN